MRGFRIPRISERDSTRPHDPFVAVPEHFIANDHLSTQFEIGLNLGPSRAGTSQKRKPGLVEVNMSTNLSSRIYPGDRPDQELNHREPEISRFSEESHLSSRPLVNNGPYLGINNDEALRTRVGLIRNRVNSDSSSSTQPGLEPGSELEHRHADRDSETQRMVLLVGLQGSGKSTFAAGLVERGWSRISQDELGTRRSCELMTEYELRLGHNVVIDRCNFDPSQRAHWIQLARERQVVVGCVVFAVPLITCIRRVQRRKDHPSLQPGPSVAGIIRSTAALFRPPDRGEGIAWCRHVRNDSDYTQVLNEILTEPEAHCESVGKSNSSCHQPPDSSRPTVN